MVCIVLNPLSKISRVKLLKYMECKQERPLGYNRKEV